MVRSGRRIETKISVITIVFYVYIAIINTSCYSTIRVKKNWIYEKDANDIDYMRTIYFVPCLDTIFYDSSLFIELYHGKGLRFHNSYEYGRLFYAKEIDRYFMLFGDSSNLHDLKVGNYFFSKGACQGQIIIAVKRILRKNKIVNTHLLKYQIPYLPADDSLVFRFIRIIRSDTVYCGEVIMKK